MELAFTLHTFSNFLGHHTDRDPVVRKTATGSVSAAYVHTDKHVSSHDNIKLGGTELKWYDLAAERSPVPDEIRRLAIRTIEDEYALGNLSELGDLGLRHAVSVPQGMDDRTALVLPNPRPETR